LILSSAQLTLTDRSFDETLRQYPVAMVAFVTPWCGRRCMELEPALQRLAVAWHETGIAIARASAETCSELLDRFEIVALPALLWFDGSKAWPHYASEAKPERYNGPQTYDALLPFIEQRVGFAAPPPAPAKPPTPPPSPMPTDAPIEPPAWAPDPATIARATEHACTATSLAYTACMRHRRDRPQLCADERHEYLLCMSGRWSIHPDDHVHLARKYNEFS